MLIPRGLAIALLIVAPATGTLGTLTPASAQDPTTHTVAVDGSADFTSVQAAVDAAASGDVVMVQPGTYTEQVVIDKDLDLIGDGPRADIVITAPTDVAGSPVGARPGSGQPFALRLGRYQIAYQSDLGGAVGDENHVVRFRLMDRAQNGNQVVVGLDRDDRPGQFVALSQGRET